MIKHLTALAAAVAAIACLTPAQAQAEVYAKAQVGLTAASSLEGYAMEDNVTFGGAVGTTVGPLRIEAGIDRIGAAISGVDFRATDYRATAYADIFGNDDGSFYVGAGLDYLAADVSSGPWSTDFTGNGWHVAAGYGHRVSSNMILEAGARYIDADFEGTNASAVAFTIAARVGL